jgi:toxin ParE1/3/4
VRLRLSRLAVSDLEAIYEYIALDSLRSAWRTVERIAELLDLLEEHPYAGRPGRVGGTRELVITRTNYLAIYRIDGDVVDIVRILHGRQQWPPPADNDV